MWMLHLSTISWFWRQKWFISNAISEEIPSSASQLFLVVQWGLLYNAFSICSETFSRQKPNSIVNQPRLLRYIKFSAHIHITFLSSYIPQPSRSALDMTPTVPRQHRSNPESQILYFSSQGTASLSLNCCAEREVSLWESSQLMKGEAR